MAEPTDGDSERLFYVHVPRTAGGTLIPLLDDRFALRQVCPVWNPLDFSRHPTEFYSPYKLIRGHCLPSDFSRVARDRTRIITFVRDPIERTKSIYRWLNTTDAAAEIQDGTSLAIAHGGDVPTIDSFSHQAIACARELSFKQFVEKDEMGGFNSNGQCLSLGAYPPYEATVADTETLRCASNLVNECLMVGITERYEESVLLLHYLMGWPAPSVIGRVHDTQMASALTDVDPRVLARVKERNELDLILYAQCKSRFEADFQRMADNLNATDTDAIRTAINNRFRQRVLDSEKTTLPVRLMAEDVWPGEGWEPREVNEHGQSWRFVGRSKRASLFFGIGPQNERWRTG